MGLNQYLFPCDFISNQTIPIYLLLKQLSIIFEGFAA